MKLFLANINEVTTGHFDLITPQRLEKALRCRFSDDQKRCVAGGLLLRAFLGDTAIAADEYGKPRAANGAFFNLSHSGDWALLALGDNEIGCDIERHRQADALRLGKVVFTENELRTIRENPDRLGQFYRFWTKKEALLKCMGKGFHRAAKSVDVCADVFSEDGLDYYIQTKVFADYTISVCTRGKKEKFTLEFFDLSSVKD